MYQLLPAGLRPCRPDGRRPRHITARLVVLVIVIVGIVSFTASGQPATTALTIMLAVILAAARAANRWLAPAPRHR